MARMSVVLVLIALCLPLFGQDAIIRGVVADPSGAVVADAKVTYVSTIAGTTRKTATDSRGSYHLNNLPLAPFTLTVEAPGFVTSTWAGELRSKVPIAHDVQFAAAGSAQQITVSGDPLVEAGSSSTHRDLDSETLEHMPQAPASKAMAAVVEMVPGVVEEENGRLHVRGSEAQPQYVIDGVPFADNVSGLYGTGLDTENLRSTEVITGNIPAEFGDKVGAIVNIATKSGLDIPWRGSVAVSGSSFDTGSTDLEVGGHFGKLGIFATADADRSRHFLDPPEIENFHNRGRLAHFFSRFDWLATSRDSLRLTLSVNGTDFQVPNTAESQDAGQNQRQELRDDFEALSWTHTISSKSVLDLSLSRRSSTARLFDPGLTGFPYYIEQHRRLRTEGARGRFSQEWKFGSFQAGGESYRFPLHEQFKLALTDPQELAASPDSPIGNYTIQDPFVFSQTKTGGRSSLFAQNRFRFFNALSADIGLRFDHYAVVVNENSVSPRIGLAYYLKRTNTVFRAAYNRLYQTPPLENILLSSSVQAAGLSYAAPANPVPVPPERQNFYEFGMQQQISRWLRVDIVRYIKNIRNFSDDQELFATAVVFPVAVAGADIRGTELSLDMVNFHGLTAHAGYANARATITTPITGGLLLSADSEESKLLTPGIKLPADQDERNELQFGTTYLHKTGAWLHFGGRFDSGLPTSFTNAEFSTFDPRIQQQLDPVRMRTKPRTVINLAGGFELMRESSHSVSIQLGATNLFDRFYLYNFRSAFSGTHIGRPREFSAKVVFNFGNRSLLTTTLTNPH